MALIALDSGAIIGILDAGDAFHDAADAKLRELLGHERLIASVVTYAELITGVHLDHQSGESTRGFFNDVINDLVPVDVAVAERAAELRGRREGLRMSDALIIATAELHADAIVTTDDEWAKLKLDCEVELLTP